MPVTSQDKNKILMTRIGGGRGSVTQMEEREREEIIVLKMDICVTSSVREDAKEERGEEVNT